MEAEYMNFRFNEEQQMMRKMVRDFAQKEIAPFVPSMEQGVFPKEILQKMGELGLMGIPAPAKYGGAEMDFISYILAIEEISKVKCNSWCNFSCTYVSWNESDFIFRNRRTEEKICF